MCLGFTVNLFLTVIMCVAIINDSNNDIKRFGSYQKFGHYNFNLEFEFISLGE